MMTVKNFEFQILETKLSLLVPEVSHIVSQPTYPCPHSHGVGFLFLPRSMPWAIWWQATGGRLVRGGPGPLPAQHNPKMLTMTFWAALAELERGGNQAGCMPPWSSENFYLASFLLDWTTAVSRVEKVREKSAAGVLGNPQNESWRGPRETSDEAEVHSPDPRFDPLRRVHVIRILLSCLSNFLSHFAPYSWEVTYIVKCEVFQSPQSKSQKGLLWKTSALLWHLALSIHWGVCVLRILLSCLR